MRVINRVHSSTTVDRLLREALPRIPNPNATALYLQNRFVQPNMTLLTAGIHDNCVLESCTNPHFSAICTSVLNDLNYIKELPEEFRTEAQLTQRFGAVIVAARSSWTNEKIKQRMIHCATLKKHLQKNARYEHCNIPFFQDMEALCDYIQKSPQLNFSLKQSFKSLTVDRTRVPTLCAFFSAKLQRFNQLAFSETDPVEKLVEEGAQAHGNRCNDNTYTGIEITSPARVAGALGHIRPTRERLLTPPRASRPTSTIPFCEECEEQTASCFCLIANCIHSERPMCDRCFFETHRVSLRKHHEKTLFKKAPLSLRNSFKVYIPQFRSGGFAILCALAEPNRSQRENEKRLRYEAQKYCRASMFEGPNGGKFSAWNAYRQLQDKNLIRVEHSNIGYEVHAGRNLERQLILSLVHPNGNCIAQSCYQFFHLIDRYYKESGFENSSAHALFTDHFTLNRIQVLRQNSSLLQHNVQRSRDELVLLIDTREDPEYRKIMRKHCERIGVVYEERNLPVGDYLFVRRPSQVYAHNNHNINVPERVQPWCIERKSWRDLASSVAGRGVNRFHCAKEGNHLGDCGGKCQICKMLASGIQRNIVLVEGAICNCSHTSTCHACKDHRQKDLPTLRELEKVLDRLVLEYGIFVVNATHFSHSTQIITQISCMLLSEHNNRSVTIPYASLMRNSRNTIRGCSYEIRENRKQAMVMKASDFSKNICAGAFSEESLGQYGQITICGAKEFLKQNGKLIESIWKKTSPPYNPGGNEPLFQLIRTEMSSLQIAPSYLYTFWTLQIQLKYGVYLRFVEQENDANAFASRWNVNISKQNPRRQHFTNTTNIVDLVDEVAGRTPELFSTCITAGKIAVEGSTQDASLPFLNVSSERNVVDLCEGKPRAGLINIESVSDAGARWTCSRCTYDNPSSAAACEMCTFAKPIVTRKIERTPSPLLLKWVCSQCTFNNSANTDVCKMCQSAKLDSKLPANAPKLNELSPTVNQLSLIRQQQKEKWMRTSSGGAARKVNKTLGIQSVGTLHQGNNLQRDLHGLVGVKPPRALDFGFAPSTSISSSGRLKRKASLLDKNYSEVNRLGQKRTKITTCGNCGAKGHARSSRMCPEYHSTQEQERRATLLEKQIDRKERETIRAEIEESAQQEILRKKTELIRAQENLNRIQEQNLSKKKSKNDRNRKRLENLKAKKARSGGRN